MGHFYDGWDLHEALDCLSQMRRAEMTVTLRHRQRAPPSKRLDTPDMPAHSRVEVTLTAPERRETVGCAPWLQATISVHTVSCPSLSSTACLKLW